MTTDHSVDRSEVLAKLRDSIEAARQKGGVAGLSVGIIQKNEIIFAEGFGKRNKQDPVTKETLMPIASITKAYTAVAVGELVAEGKMDWDKTPVNKYLPEFELKDPVLTKQLTMLDLLSHRTNLPDMTMSWFRNKTPRQELIKRLRHIDMPSKLTSTTNYSNVLYGVAGEAAASVAGMKYEDIVRTKVLKPLGLHNTDFSPLKMAKTPNHSVPFTSDSFENAIEGLFEEGPIGDDFDAHSAGSSLYADITDLVNFGNAIMNRGRVDGKQVLNEETTKEVLKGHSIMARPKRDLENAPVLTYGMGWMIDTFKGQAVYRHSGFIPGYISQLYLLPDSDLVIGVMNNTNSSGLTDAIVHLCIDQILNLPVTMDWIERGIEKTKSFYEEDRLAAEGSEDLPERIEGTTASRSLDSCVGDFSSPVHGDISIKLVQDPETKEEHLSIEWLEWEAKLGHYHYDSYRVQFKSFAMAMNGTVTMCTGLSGQMDTLEIKGDFFNEVAIFKRLAMTTIEKEE